ncbi:FAD-binding protein [Burkholderia sp. Ac-20353]|uniref:NAD(P)/FAD-dependent oxidoreductase n=1 Tax=Burkholderia sp. Ac-20353 TaxID=2703894 RepID=UPI00197C92E4|nr:FAD-binding protein [Burkholderia sp. Ac-20353]MBN3788849.1 FAD-binding protein [Burkholderia sp. Ac-20353]
MRAFDVLVVGDGPAGCAAAIAAARAGGDVWMLGRGRSHTAPECVSGAALKLLDRLSPSLARQPDTWLDGHADAQRGRAVIRSRFDDGLRAEALAAGVRYSRVPAGGLIPRVEHGTVAGITHGDGDVGASVVIDATGLNGWLRRALRLDVTIDSSRFWLRRGYARADQARIGTTWQIARSGWLWLRATSTLQIWTSLSMLRDGDIAWPVDAMPIGPVWRECRRWQRLRQAAGPGYIVCGDAAGCLDPATGDGLRFAIASGLHAGAMAVEVARHPDRANVLAALYCDWVAQSYERNRTVLAQSYTREGLDIGWRDPACRLRVYTGKEARQRNTPGGL